MSLGSNSSKLSPEQIHQLKRISIIDLFQGQQVKHISSQDISLSFLADQLKLDKLSLYRMLTQLNTEGVISIKISEIYAAATKRKQTK